MVYFCHLKYTPNFFFHKKHWNFSGDKTKQNKNLVLLSLKQGKISQQHNNLQETLVNTSRQNNEKEIPHQIRMIQQTHMKPANWTLQKLFQNCCNSKVPMTVQWNSWGFYNYDILLQFLSIWSGPHLHFPTTSPFERWLEKHHHPTQTLPLGHRPFTHKWSWSHNGHPLLLIKRGMARYRPLLELREFSPFLCLKFTLLLHVLPNQGAQPRAELEQFWGTGFLGRSQKNSQVSVLLSLFFVLFCFSVWVELTFNWDVGYPLPSLAGVRQQAYLHLVPSHSTFTRRTHNASPSSSSPTTGP